MFPLVIFGVVLTLSLIILAIADSKWVYDPRVDAKLYAALKNAREYVPGDQSQENLRRGQAAVEGFREVLRSDPKNLSAIDGIGLMLFQIGGQPYDATKIQESRLYFRQHVQLKPEDPEPHYWIGVMNWTLSFHANGDLRARYNDHAAGKQQVRAADLLPNDLRQEFAREFGATIDEGIDSLKHAIELRPGYDDAMGYLSLLYRCKADTAAYQEERNRFLKVADDLAAHVKEIKQTQARALQR